MDLLDDLIFGPLNLINRAEGWLKRAAYRDAGVQFQIPRQDKGGRFSLPEVRQLLLHYGIDSFGCTHDARSIYFFTKQRQAAWAEYLLLHAGVELQNPPVDPRNAGYVASHPPGWMPPPWAQGRDPGLTQANDDESSESPQRDQQQSTWSTWSRAIDRWLDE